MSAERLLLSQIMLGLSVFGLLTCGAWAWLRPGHRWFAVAPATWFLHVCAFYLFVVSWRSSPSEFFTGWSLILRYHALFLILGGISLFIRRLEPPYES